ncbi:MAG: PQQ-like beta-propeller repeat protein [Verrucomicrobia bacterium]|nr:PQQ-like beta-propeller repeat protein [Verrucomicrobiota bacterium]
MNEKIPDPSLKVGNTFGAPAANSVTSPQRKTGLPWFPVVTLALVVAGIAAVQWRPELERNLRAWATAALALLGTLTLLIWFLASSRFRARTRLVGLAFVVLCGLALKGSLRVDGTINGTGLPRLVWRASHADATPPTASPAETARNPVHGVALPGLEDSAQFLGPNRTGVLPVARFSTNWTTQAPRELWRRPIGLGWSSFAVVGGQAWTQEQVGDDERVICLDVATGQTVWSHSERTRFSEWQGGDGPRATPTVQDGRVYAMGGTGILLCLDAATGRLVWRRSVLEENGLSNLIWGTSSSPLIVNDLTVITGGRGSGAVLFAYRSSDGSPAWKSGEGDASYASPILATLAGRRVILSNNAASLTAHDPATGRLLFDHAWGGSKWPKASQPVVLPGDRVFVSGGYGMGCQIIQVKPGEAGSDRATGTLKTETAWKGITMKTQFNNPGLRNGYVYGLDDGLLACIDATTGRRIWKDGRFGSGQTLIVGDTVVVQNENGTVHACVASPDGFRELGQIAALSSKTWNQPAVAGRYLLVRNDREAVCWELPAAGR